MSQSTKHTPESLMLAAAQWRDYAAGCPLPEQRRLAESAARSLERQAGTGVATCLCCGKPFGQGTLNIARATGRKA